MGLLTLPTLRGWNPLALAAAGQQVATTSASVDDGLRATTRAMDDVAAGWSGLGYDAATTRMGTVTTAGNRTSTALVGLADTLTSAATDLAAVRAHALNLVETARQEGFLIFDNGRVQAPGVTSAALTLPSINDQQGRLNAGAEQHASIIFRALAAVVQADTDWAAKITAAVDQVVDLAASIATSAPTVRAAVQSILDGHTHLPSNPQGLHDFWEGLTAEEKEALFAAEPGIGNRDAIPVIDRNHFNERQLLALQEAEEDHRLSLQAQHTEWRNGFPANQYRYGQGVGDNAAYLAWKKEVDASTTALDGYTAVTKAMAGGPSGDPPRFLMGIDSSDRAIIASRNPDIAENVATSVPGTGTSLEGMEGGVRRSEAMMTQAEKTGGTTSLITWFGYAAPAGLSDATDVKYADRGASSLGNFQQGLRVTHDGPPSHNVVVGHSYGTTVVGTAVTESTPLPVNDVILVASPGANADGVGDFNLAGVPHDQTGSHVYATAALGDPVPLYSGTGDFGPNPDGPLYGSTTFHSDARAPWEAHSSYWDLGDSSLINMGLIISGNGGRVS